MGVAVEVVLPVLVGILGIVYRFLFRSALKNRLVRDTVRLGNDLERILGEVKPRIPVGVPKDLPLRSPPPTIERPRGTCSYCSRVRWLDKPCPGCGSPEEK